MLADDRYVVEIIAQRVTGPTYVKKRISLDTHFDASRYAERYGANPQGAERRLPALDRGA